MGREEIKRLVASMTAGGFLRHFPVWAVVGENQKYWYANMIKGTVYRDRFIRLGDGLYTNQTDAFFCGGLRNCSRAITSACGGGAVAGTCVEYEDKETMAKRYRIRKFTPKECFRLMGVDDADIAKIQATGISNGQQYKLAGNSIVVDVLAYIFENLFSDDIEKDELF